LKIIHYYNVIYEFIYLDKIIKYILNIFNQLIIIEYLLQTSKLVNGNNSSKKSIMVSIYDLIYQLKILKWLTK